MSFRRHGEGSCPPSPAPGRKAGGFCVVWRGAKGLSAQTAKGVGLWYDNGVMMLINLFCSLLAVLVTLGPVRALGLPRWGVVLAGVVLVGLAQQTLAHRAFGASLLSPDALPLPLVALFLWGTAFLLSAGGLTVAWLGLRLCHVAVSGWWPLALGAAAGVFVVWMGVRTPPVREREVVLPGLPAEAEGLRVAVLADIHVDRWRGRAWCERLVGRVNGARPDLILFTGDQADGPLALRWGDLEPLGGLRAPEGAFLITGNHEHYFETEAYLRFYEGLGIRVLDGQTATVRGLGLMGLPDRRSLTRLGDDAIQLRGLREALPRGAFPVLLVHKPGIAPEADALGVGLQLSGHTHGGQVPGVALAIRHFNGGFVRGWYTLPRGMRLFVAPGSGVWLGFPYRLYPSEITVLTLRGGGAAGGAKKEKS